MGLFYEKLKNTNYKIHTEIDITENVISNIDFMNEVINDRVISPAKLLDEYMTKNQPLSYIIFIFAFKNRLNAHKAARNARNIVPEQLGNLPASLSKITRTSNRNKNLEYLWRVRFIELAENQARSVCAELWTSGLSCIPLPSNNKS